VLEAKLPIAHLSISTHRAGDEGPASPLTAADARIQCEQMRCELEYPIHNALSTSDFLHWNSNTTRETSGHPRILRAHSELTTSQALHITASD